MKDIVLFGIGGTAQVLFYHFERESKSVVAFTVDREYLDKETLFNRPVIPFSEIAEKYPPDDFDMMIAVGFINGNKLRAERMKQAVEMGYKMISYVSSTAILPDDFDLKSNCKIGERTILQPYSKIGKNVFIGSGCIIGHHAVVKDHCFLASGVMIGGGVKLEPYCFLGIGSSIRNDVTIGQSSVVGAGVTIQKDIQAESVYLNRTAEKMNITSRDLYRK